MHYFTASVPGLHNGLSLLRLGDVVNATTVYIRIGTDTTLDIPTPWLSLDLDTFNQSAIEHSGKLGTLSNLLLS